MSIKNKSKNESVFLSNISKKDAGEFSPTKIILNKFDQIIAKNRKDLIKFYEKVLK